jgi:hypothetical protein
MHSSLRTTKAIKVISAIKTIKPIKTISAIKTIRAIKTIKTFEAIKTVKTTKAFKTFEAIKTIKVIKASSPAPHHGHRGQSPPSLAPPPNSWPASGPTWWCQEGGGCLLKRTSGAACRCVDMQACACDAGRGGKMAAEKGSKSECIS